MSDIGIFFDGTSFCLQYENGDLKADAGLETAVLISLFSDQRITEEELPQKESDRKGWWGDLLTEVEGDQIGSKLWLLDRSKISDDVLADFEAYAQNALQWMVEDGVAKTVSVTSDFSDTGVQMLDIEITKPDNSVIRISQVWDGQEAKG